MGVTAIEELPNNKYLKFKHDQLYQVREMYNLEKPERVKEAISLLREWIDKQDHFNKKDFRDDYLEILLISSKGSMERAKSRLDKLCTYRTIWPQYFSEIDVNSLRPYFKVFNSIILPEVTEDYTRVNIFKIHSNVPLSSDLLGHYMKYAVIIGEYIKLHDYPNGFVVLLDYREVNLLDLISIISPTMLQQMMKLVMDAYGMRVQGIHLVTTSKVSDALIRLLKQVMSKKLGDRIHVHKSIETVHEFIPKKILPKEYGGDAASMSEITEDFLEALGSKEHQDYMKIMQDATIDLSKKPKDSSIEELAMTGSFRTLSVD